MATTTDSRTSGRSLPQPSDLLLVQRGSTPYRATAEEVKAFMLTPATAAAIKQAKPLPVAAEAPAKAPVKRVRKPAATPEAGKEVKE